MGRLTFTLLFPILSVLFICANCAQSNSHSRKPVTSIQLEPSKKSFKLGEELKINLLTKLKEGKLDKIDVYIDGIQVQSSKNFTNSVVYKTTDWGVGKHVIKVSAIKTDGISGDNYEEFLVTSDQQPTKYSFQVIAEFPHNSKHFTQGLEFHDNKLYEGTGQEGSSGIFLENLQSGKTIKEYNLEKQYFGEGITILNNKIFQLTYKNQIGFVYDLNSFNLLNTWKYKSAEGWGLTNDGHLLIMSDGSENIYFINPETYREERKIQVCNESNVVKNINELEYVKGEIWANIWNTDIIVIIDPKTGKVTGEINLAGLAGTILQNEREQMDVLNGIAWNPSTDKIYLTGKLWPKIFEIKLLRK